jgi:hypothetical protein
MLDLSVTLMAPCHASSTTFLLFNTLSLCKQWRMVLIDLWSGIEKIYQVEREGFLKANTIHMSAGSFMSLRRLI